MIQLVENQKLIKKYKDKKMNNEIKINIGCSKSPTKGWINYDNSYGLILSKFGPIINMLYKLRIISEDQLEVASSYKENKVILANVIKKIPHKNNSVDVVYSSHMLEHFSQEDAKKCLIEIRRILKKDGILRLALPDLKAKVDEYIKSGDADNFIYETYMWPPTPKSFIGRLYLFFTGPRHHQWMYDSNSLIKLLLDCGFINPKSLQAGDTLIPNPGNLNLFERDDDSFYVEATS